MGYWREGGSRIVKLLVEAWNSKTLVAKPRQQLRRLGISTPPDPIPNRPLRGQRQRQRSQQSPPSHTRRHHKPPTPARRPSPPLSISDSNNDTNNNSSLLSDQAFLDKFKLGPINKKDESTKLLYYDDDNNVAKEKLEAEEAQVENKKKNNNEAAEPDQLSPPPDADDIFRKMKETGLIPNAVAMLDGLCKDGLVQEAMKLFNLMREKGSFPDVIVYTAVVEAFCKAHQLDHAKRIFRKMQDNGIPPNAFSYGVLIRGLYNSNHLDDAVDFCLHMLDAGHSPNLPTFVGLVDRLCRDKGVHEARSVVSTLCQRGFFLNKKAVADFLDKNAPTSSPVAEAIFGKRESKGLF